MNLRYQYSFNYKRNLILKELKMSRVIPPNKNNSSSELPSWMDAKAIVQAGAGQVQKHNEIQKTASTDTTTVVATYSCPACKKTYRVDNAAIKTQASANIIAGRTSFDPVCPNCTSVLVADKILKKAAEVNEIRTVDGIEVKKDLTRRGSGTYNTFVDRHVAYKAMNELRNFCVKSGMIAPEVRYVKSDHTTIAGQDYPTLNDIYCKIDWLYGKNQKARVYASVSVDAAGKVVLPKTFITSDLQEFAFEKESIKELEANAVHIKSFNKDLRPTDIPSFRKPDVTRFHATASLNKKADQDKAMEIEDEYLAHCKAMGGEPDTDSLLEFIDKHYPGTDQSTVDSVMNRVQSMEPKDGFRRKAYDSMLTPTPASNPITAPPAGVQQQPNNNQPYTPGTQLMNPVDNKTYVVKEQTPGVGIKATDPMGNEVIIPDTNAGSMKPVVRTSSEEPVEASLQSKALAEALIKKHLEGDVVEDLGHGNQLDQAGMDELADKERSEAQEDIDMLNEITSSIADLVGIDKTAAREAVANRYIGRVFNVGDAKLKVVEPGSGFVQRKETEEPSYWVEVVSGSYRGYSEGEQFTMNASTLQKHLGVTSSIEDPDPKKKVKAHVPTMSQNWRTIRASLKEKQAKKLADEAVNTPIEKQTRQQRAINERTAYSPSPVPKSSPEGRDTATGVPMDAGDQKFVASPEFDSGYDRPLEQANKDAMENREVFNKERQKLKMMNQKEIREMLHKNKAPDYNDGTDTPEVGKGLENMAEATSALESIIGIKKEAVYGSYDRWLEENREELQNEYRNYTSDVELDGIIPVSFEKWAKTQYDSVYGEGGGEMDFGEFDVEGSRKTAADEATTPPAEGAKPAEEKKIPEKPLQYKELKKAPGVSEYEEPAVIPTAAGKVKEAITKFKQVQSDILKLKTDMDVALKPYIAKLNEAKKPFDENIKVKSELLSTYLNMVYDQIRKTSESVVAYEDYIIAAVTTDKQEAGSQVTLSQVLKRLDETLPEISAKVKEIEKALKAERVTDVIERTIYHYPQSEVQKKKVTTALDNLTDLIHTLSQVVNDLAFINKALEIPVA